MLLDYGIEKGKIRGKIYDITAVKIYSGSFQVQHNQQGSTEPVPYTADSQKGD